MQRLDEPVADKQWSRTNYAGSATRTMGQMLKDVFRPGSTSAWLRVTCRRVQDSKLGFGVGEVTRLAKRHQLSRIFQLQTRATFLFRVIHQLSMAKWWAWGIATPETHVVLAPQITQAWPGGPIETIHAKCATKMTCCAKVLSLWRLWLWTWIVSRCHWYHHLRTTHWGATFTQAHLTQSSIGTSATDRPTRISRQPRWRPQQKSEPVCVGSKWSRRIHENGRD